jgi:5-enolpyruvylshikimate-3-phosphate synthase
LHGLSSASVTNTADGRATTSARSACGAAAAKHDVQQMNAKSTATGNPIINKRPTNLLMTNLFMP